MRAAPAQHTRDFAFIDCVSSREGAAARGSRRAGVRRPAPTRRSGPGARDPAEEEREAGAEQQARVDVRGGADDALLEQVRDLVGHRLEHRFADLLDRPRRVAGDVDLVARRRSRRASARAGTGPGRRRASSRARGSRPAGRPSASSDRRRHRHPQPEHRLVRLLDRVAVLERVHQHARHAGQHAVDDESGRVRDEDAALARASPRRPRRSRASRRRSRGVRIDLDERHQRDRVEEVHADEPLGMLRGPRPSRSPRARTCSSRGRTRARTTASSSAKTSCFTSISSNTASSTRSQPANAS